jgi:hypothetical protein
MPDKRELILVRLLKIAQATFGANRAFRNTEEIPEEARPACLIHDGSEEAAESDPQRPRGRAGVRIVSMTPEIAILLGDDPDNVGAALNAKRAALMVAIEDDTTLVSYLLNSDGLRYQAWATNLESGRQTEAIGFLSYELTYLLKTSDLAD